MNNEIILAQQLNLKEFFLGSLYVPKFHIFLKGVLLLVSVLSISSNFLGYITTGKVQWSKLVQIPLSLLFVTIVIVLAYFLICLFVYKFYAHLFVDVSYTFTQEGIKRKSQHTIFEKPWQEITFVKETPYAFLFLVSDGDYHIIQKRMVESLITTHQFRNFISTKTIIK